MQLVAIIIYIHVDFKLRFAGSDFNPNSRHILSLRSGHDSSYPHSVENYILTQNGRFSNY